MGIEDEIKPVKDLLELLAKFETAPQGKEDDYVYHGTSTDKLKGIISSNGLKGNLNPALEKIGKHADKFLKYTNPELYNKGFSRTKGVYAFVDTNFHLDRSSASGEQLIFKINASGLDAIVLDMNMVTEASHGLNDYMDYKRTESTELPFPEEKRKEFLIRFKKFIKEYWGKAVYLRDFKKRFKLTDKTDYLLTYSDGETTINDPEVLIKGDVPLNHLQIYSYPESIQQLFSKIGVSTAKEALALVQSNDKENKEDKEIPDMTTETFNLKENDMLYNPKTKTQRIVQGVHGDNVKVLRIDRRTGIQRTEVHSIERINRYLSNGKLIHQGNLGRKPVTQKQEDEYQEAKSGQIKRNNTATEKRMRENIPNILSHMKAGDTSRDWRAMLENYRSYAEKNGLRDLEDDIDKAIRSIFEETEPEKPNKTEIVQNITQKRISDILLHMHEYDLEEAEYALKTLDLLRKNSKKNNLPATILAEIDTTIQAVKTQEEIVRTQGPMTNEQMQGISVQRRIKNAKMAYKDAVDFLKDIGTNPKKRKKLADFISKAEGYENFTEQDLKEARLINRTIDDEIFEDVYGLKSLDISLFIPRPDNMPRFSGINLTTEIFGYPLNKIGSLSIVFESGIVSGSATKEHESIHHAEEIYSERSLRTNWAVDDHILSELNAFRSSARYGVPWHDINAILIEDYLEPLFRKAMKPGGENIFRDAMRKYTILISKATGTMQYLQEHLPESAITHIIMNTEKLSDLIKWHDVSPDRLKELTGQPRTQDAGESQERREVTRVDNRLTNLFEQINAANKEMARAKTPERQREVKIAMDAYKGEVIALKNFIKKKE